MGQFLLNKEVRKDPDGGEKGAASFSPIGHMQMAKWQSCCHGNLFFVFQLSLAGSDRCVKPCGQLESRELTPSHLFSVVKFGFLEAHKK